MLAEWSDRFAEYPYEVTGIILGPDEYEDLYFSCFLKGSRCRAVWLWRHMDRELPIIMSARPGIRLEVARA